MSEKNFATGLLSQRTDGSVIMVWKEDDSQAKGDIHAGGVRNGLGFRLDDIQLTFDVDPDLLAKFKERRANGDEKAHHQIIGRGKIGDLAVVGFPAAGNRIGLRPDTSAHVGFDFLD